MYIGEIWTYGSGSYVGYVFEAIKLIVGDGSYVTLVRLFGLMGILAIMLSALRMRGSGTISADWSYLIAFAFVYLGLIVPKVDVTVRDRLDDTFSQTVTSVPLGLGVFAWAASGIGDGLTRKYETFISMPNDQQYSKNGMLFGSRLLHATGNQPIPDPSLAQDVNNVLRDCILPRVSRGEISINQIAQSSDIWNDIVLVYAPSNRYVTDHTGTVHECSTFANNTLNPKVAQAVNAANTRIGKVIKPGLNDSLALTFITNSGPGVYQDYLGMTTTAGNITRNAMMIGAVRQAMASGAVDTNDPAMSTAMYAAQAEAAQRNTYQIMGNTAARTLPVMRAVVEAIVFALFPIVALMMLLPSWLSAIGQYLLVMMWLQVWPLLYAVLNSIMTWYGQPSVRIEAQLQGDGWSTQAYAIDTFANITGFGADMIAMAGYLAISIPMISWMLVKGGANIAASVASGLAQPAQSAAQQSGSQATGGQLTTNTLTMDTSSMNSMNAHRFATNPEMSWGSAMSKQTDALGATRMASAGGISTTNHMAASDVGVFKASATRAVGQAIDTQAEQSRQAALDKSVQFTKADTGLYSNMTEFIGQNARSGGTGSMFSDGTGFHYARATDDVQQLARKFAQDHKIDDKAAHELLAGGGVGGSFFRAWAQSKSSSEIQDVQSAAKEYSAKNDYSQKWDEAREWGSKFHAEFGMQFQDALSQRVGGGFQQRAELAESTQAALKEAEAWRQAKQHKDEQGVRWEADINPVVLGVMREKLGNDEAGRIIATAGSDSPEAGLSVQKGTRFLNENAQDIAARYAGIQTNQIPDSNNVDRMYTGAQAEVLRHAPEVNAVAGRGVGSAQAQASAPVEQGSALPKVPDRETITEARDRTQKSVVDGQYEAQNKLDGSSRNAEEQRQHHEAERQKALETQSPEARYWSPERNIVTKGAVAGYEAYQEHVGRPFAEGVNALAGKLGLGTPAGDVPPASMAPSPNPAAQPQASAQRADVPPAPAGDVPPASMAPSPNPAAQPQASAQRADVPPAPAGDVPPASMAPSPNPAAQPQMLNLGWGEKSKSGNTAVSASSLSLPQQDSTAPNDEEAQRKQNAMNLGIPPQPNRPG